MKRTNLYIPKIMQGIPTSLSETRMKQVRPTAPCYTLKQERSNWLEICLLNDEKNEIMKVWQKG